MGGSTQNTQSTSSKTEPWAPSIPILQGILGQSGALLGNTGLTGNENQAFDSLTSNARAGNPFAARIGQLADDLFSGGTDRSGMAQSAYDAYRNALTPLARGDYVDPANNPALRNYLDVIQNDVTNSINGQFAGAGRDLSGMNTQTLARGIAQGEAPALLDAYNAAINRQLGAANSLYGAGNTTAGVLSGLDQTALANRQAGLGAATAAQQARDAGANQLLAVEAQRRGIPLQNLTALAGIATPIAHLGSQSNSTGTSTQTVPLGQQILGGLTSLGKAGAFGQPGWLLSGSNGLLGGVGSALGGLGSGVGGLLGGIGSGIGGALEGLGAFLPFLFSDARVKEDIAPVGALYDGSTVYSYRHAGEPATRIGLIAQDVQPRRPDAVADIGGLKAVDYGRATALARTIGGLLQRLGSGNLPR